MVNSLSSLSSRSSCSTPVIVFGAQLRAFADPTVFLRRRELRVALATGTLPGFTSAATMLPYVSFSIPLLRISNILLAFFAAVAH